MQSAIYLGQLSHRRFGDVRHAFRYRSRLLYLDLAELPEVFDPHWLWSARRAAPAWFRRADHLGVAGMPLDQSVRSLVREEAGIDCRGPIRLLTHLRYFGYHFDPLSVFYCFDRDEHLQAVVLEVSNMPWREMHPYVLTRGAPIANGGFRFDFAKRFHVSPFLPMRMDYRCRLAPPGATLALALENWRDGRKVFDAHLSLRREVLNGRTLARLLAVDPLATLHVSARIHWQALRLWLKSAPVYDHPHDGPGRHARST